jgi:non-canonical (house-cleaning) NTP pyrophosphatase
MVSETDFRGGVFDVLPGNARTNLTEGAIGYFTDTQVIRDTLVIE